jgi:hypothetical protein
MQIEAIKVTARGMRVIQIIFGFLKDAHKNRTRRIKPIIKVKIAILLFLIIYFLCLLK